MPLFEGREMSFTGDFKKMLEMEYSFDMKIEDVPILGDNAEGSVRPDLMFKVTNCQMQPPIQSQKPERPSSFNLILHFVVSLEDQELLSTHSVVDCFEDLRQKFSQCFQGNESLLKNDIKQSFLEIFEKRYGKGSRQRQKEEALERAVPTVVEAITTILSHSTNEKFRKNCLAYAGATDTMELASFLTDNLTSITNRSLYPKEVEHLDCAGPSELVATMTDKGSFSILSEYRLDGSSTEELEELNDLDLLQAFSQGTDHESCSGEFNQDTVNDSLQGAESYHWTDLSQTTDEIVKSLLEDSLDEDLLSADWLITEE
ncbi:hypothetical protein HOLleu_08347 [Holothuria leucospilota]|uniref:Uncharacterized protein n=1 Tax=Holothuria leucospilota TaxID=206669 RepID=A0A9Q1CHD3_HOLLE|nr:hypothetical protein HOLleu_08347 [Holothuria leucospilota]